MRQAFILAAITAAVVAAPGRHRERKEEKLRNDKNFQAFAAKYNKDITKTETFRLKQMRYHMTDNKINAQNAKSLPGDKYALRF